MKKNVRITAKTARRRQAPPRAADVAVLPQLSKERFFVFRSWCPAGRTVRRCCSCDALQFVALQLQTGSRKPESQRFSSISESPCKLLFNSATDSVFRSGNTKTRPDDDACQSGLVPTALAEFITRPQAESQIGAMEQIIAGGMRLSRIDQLQKDIPLEWRCDLATTKWVARMRLVGASSNGCGGAIDTSWDGGAPFHLLPDLVLQCTDLLRTH